VIIVANHLMVLHTLGIGIAGNITIINATLILNINGLGIIAGGFILRSGYTDENSI